MLLRASEQTDGLKLDLSTIHGIDDSTQAANLAQTRGINHAALIVEYAEATVDLDASRLDRAIAQVEATLGTQALVDSAATAAIFHAVVKVADATGIPLEPAKEEATQALRDDLRLDQFREGRDV